MWNVDNGEQGGAICCCLLLYDGALLAVHLQWPAYLRKSPAMYH